MESGPTIAVPPGMIRNLFVVVATAISIPACITAEPPVYEGEPFVADYGPSWQVYCPRFDDRKLPTINVLFEGDTVTVDGAPAWNVSRLEGDDTGGYEVTFSIAQTFPLNGRAIPVVIDFEGYAGFDILSLDGSVKFSEPSEQIGDCAMAVHLSGQYVEAPEWRR